jgi:hypothetical protein
MIVFALVFGLVFALWSRLRPIVVEQPTVDGTRDIAGTDSDQGD